jgi:hypothetical protein
MELDQPRPPLLRCMGKQEADVRRFARLETGESSFRTTEPIKGTRMPQPPTPRGALPNLQAIAADQQPLMVPLVGESLAEAQSLQDALGLASVEEVVYVGLALCGTREAARYRCAILAPQRLSASL